MEASGLGWDNESVDRTERKYRRDFREQNYLDPQLCGCGVTVMWEKKTQETMFGLPCRGVPATDMRNRNLRHLQKQSREENEFSFRNICCCCYCWKNVQEKLSGLRV